MSVEGSKSVHPFFNKSGTHTCRALNSSLMPSSASTKPAPDHSRDETRHDEEYEYDLVDQHGDAEEKPKRARSKRKTKNDKAKNQPTLADIVNPKSEVLPQDAVVEQDVLEPSLQDGPRKRRRTSADADIDDIALSGSGAYANINGRTAAETISIEPTAALRSSPRVIIPRSSPLPPIQPLEESLIGPESNEAVAKTTVKKVLKLNANGRFSSPTLKSPKRLPKTSAPVLPTNDDLAQNDVTDAVEMTPPKKVLKLNANGRFSSPPSKDPKTATEPDPQPSGRLRHRKPAGKTRSLLVSIPYGGHDSSKALIGEKIDNIIAGILTVPIKKSSPQKQTPQKPRKPTHPFFSGKPQQSLSVPKSESPRKTSAVTPGKLRVKAFSERLPEINEVEFSSALLKDRHMMKHPGAIDAPFPDKNQVHVRGEAFKIKQPMYGLTVDRLFARRKHKQAILPLATRESVIARFEARLVAAEDARLRSDGFLDPRNSLRVPERHLLSGQEIAERISGELSVPIAAFGRDELSLSTNSFIKSSPHSRRPSQDLQEPHSALSRLYDRIPNTLTAFDECRGEALGWTQKYAPSTSADVLQPENELAVLRNWLRSLSVQAVDSAVTDAKSVQPKVTEKPKKKRKKKADDMDDFLVDTDEDVREMNEIPVVLGTGMNSGSLKTKGSIVQSLSHNLKLSNTVLLSGPHGCGKTATAYAVAKELGFKVFEISSSERRSGRDVLEKVGDMTENHMVRHHGVEFAESRAPETDRNDEAFHRDLESGRQGTMGAFFKSKPTKRIATKPKKIVQDKEMKVIREAIKKPARDQQQSLILLEEVDILFRDDKDFWMTVIKLITTSKRPFLMTCNDETVLPLQAISLHAILRLKEPPLDLATDLLLLMAAAEGHLLKREAVLSLYQSHQSDLRASITELDYWCQMGVGDPRGGLSWIYQRYPPGSDLDEQGRKLRIVSANTYQSNMGLPSELELDAHGALEWAWNEFDIAPATALGWYAMPADVQEEPVSDTNRRKLLSQFSRHADALSAADACTARGINKSAPFDHSQPELTEKARNNYIVGQELLQSNNRTDYVELSKNMLIAMTLSARQIYDLTLSGEAIISRSLSNRVISKDGDDTLTRHTFACFDPIATSSELSLNNNPGLMQSVFDGTFKTLTLDLAPYVRSIVHYDKALEEQRARLNLLKSAGRSSKRQRTTRAARSALEGGQRATTRKERWFANELDFEAVLATGGKDWPRESYSPRSVDCVSKDGTEGTAPVSSADSA